MRRVLFVDDEPMVLKALEAVLYRQRSKWEMVFVSSAAVAPYLAGEPFDVVVADMRMPELDGAELLSRVARDWPRAGRILFTAHPDPGVLSRAARVAHVRLDKPCSPDALRETIEDAMP